MAEWQRFAHVVGPSSSAGLNGLQIRRHKMPLSASCGSLASERFLHRVVCAGGIGRISPPADAERARTSGCDGFFTKPVNFEALVEALRAPPAERGVPA